jgi:hypothetical protein
MNLKNYRILPFICFCFFTTITQSLGQESNSQKGTTISTAPKLVVAKLKVAETKVFFIRGDATFTITAAHSDDTLSGTLHYKLSEEQRTWIAELTQKQLADIPLSLDLKNEVANFEKNTQCPELHLELDPMDVYLAGAQVHFNRFVLSIKETPRELSKLLCLWIRRINNGRDGPVVYPRINKILSGEEAEKNPLNER